MIIPNKNESGWHELLSGKKKVSLSSFVLKVKLAEVQERLDKNTISTDDSIAQLHNLCVKYHKSDLIVSDLRAIFGDDAINDTPEDTVSIMDSSKQKDELETVLEKTKEANTSPSLDGELESVQNKLNEALVEKEKIEKKLKLEIDNRVSLFKKHQKELTLAENNIRKYKDENDRLKLQLKAVLTDLKELKDSIKLDFDKPKNKKSFMKGVWDILSES